MSVPEQQIQLPLESTSSAIPPGLWRSTRVNEKGDIGEWLSEQLARFTYKPGWTFEIISSGTNRLYGAEWALRISVKVEDTYNPGKTIDVSGFELLWHAEHLTADSFAVFVANVIKHFEIHESREWFKRDGIIWDNPHK